MISPCIFFREISSFPIVQERSYSSAIFLGRPFFHDIWKKEIGFSREQWLIKLICTRHLSHCYHFFRESDVIFRSWKSGPSSSELLGDLNWGVTWFEKGDLISLFIPSSVMFRKYSGIFRHIQNPVEYLK